MRSSSRKLAVLAAILTMVLTMTAPTFAASAAKDPVQDKSSDTATLYLGKVLTVTQPNKFPSVTDYNFRLEAVKAWDNANVSTSLSGKDIPKADMPMPAPSSDEHHKVAIIASGAASVQAGDFSGKANTSLADTTTQKYRCTPVNIKFKKAGYYMYKITETSSLPEAVPGMAYDNNSYYAVIYVCNKTDDHGNTVDGVYVHDITSYRNSPESSYGPDLSDIQNKTDNNNVAAAPNTFDNLAKTGKTPRDPGPDPETGNPIGPNKLEAFRFFNDQTTHDVVVTNNVTGNLGDITKEFEYTVSITGLEKGKLYTTDVDAQDKTDKKTTSPSADIEALNGGKGTIDSAAKTFTSDADGNAVFRIKLADEEIMVFNALPATAKYKIEELASDHIASFNSESTEPEKWIMTLKDKANTHSDTSISTNEETVDAVSNIPGRDSSAANDGTVTINFVNHRNLLTPTGLPFYGEHMNILAAFIGAGIVFLVLIRKRNAAGDYE